MIYILYLSVSYPLPILLRSHPLSILSRFSAQVSLSPIHTHPPSLSAIHTLSFSNAHASSILSVYIFPFFFWCRAFNFALSFSLPYHHFVQYSILFILPFYIYRRTIFVQTSFLSKQMKAVPNSLSDHFSFVLSHTVNIFCSILL